MRFLLALLASALVVCLLAAAPAPASARGCKGADRAPSAANAAQIRHATLCLLNVQRRAHGLARLRANRRLARAATRHSRDMVARGYFDHTSPAGDTPLARASAVRYVPRRRAWQLAENIAWGTGSLATPRATVRAWMHSPPHRRNVLDASLRDAGTGVALGSPFRRAGATYTLALGVRR